MSVKAAASLAQDAGCAIYEHVFDHTEMIRVVECLAAARLSRTRAGARCALDVPAIRDFASDARLVRLAAQFIGSNPFAFRATLFDKSSRANWLVAWHQDTMLPLRRRVDNPAWGPWSLKAGVLHARAPASALERVVAMRVHLDDSTHENGPLRVLPGTHTGGVLTAEAIERTARGSTPVTCAAPRGSVVAMRPLTIHSSGKSRDAQPRRVLHIEYAASADLGDGAELFDARATA